MESPAPAPAVLLVRNDVFADENGTRFRLLEVLHDVAWVINLNDRNSWPTCHQYDALIEQIKGRHFCIVKPKVRRQLPFCTPAAVARKKSAFATIEPLIVNPEIYDPRQRGSLVKQRAAETGHSRTTIFKYLRAYWIGGLTEDALIPFFPSIGRRQIHQTNHRGRRSENYAVYQIKESDIKNVKSAVNEFYFHNETRTLAATYSRMLDDHYAYLDGNGDSYINPLGKRPSMHQFRYIVKKSFPLDILLRKRKGKKEFNRDHNQHLSGALYDAIGAGHTYEIDATIADVWLVAKANRKDIIGKPTMYLIYDRYSRLCVGFYVGLESACWESAMQAILSIAEDKAEKCRKCNVPYDPANYPADGIYPSKFLGDCGMICRNSNRICDGMEGTLVNATPLSPQTKGTVECGFRLIHCRIAAITPGYDPPSNAKRRRGKHYDRDACLTVDEFTSVILLAISHHNRTLMKNYQASPEVLLRIRPTPIALWNDSVINQIGNLRRYSEDYLHLKLLPRSEATITKEGILFKNCYYSCHELEEKCWFIAAANKGRSQVSVSFDRRLVDAIIVYDPNDKQAAYRCVLTPRSLHFKGYSFTEVEYVIRRLKEIIKDDEEDAQQRRSDLTRYTAEITDPAFAEMKIATQGKSRRFRKAETASTRSAEKAERRQAEATMPTLHGEDHGPSSPKTSESRSNGSSQDRVKLLPSNVARPTATTECLQRSDLDPVPATTEEHGTKPLSIEERLAQKRLELHHEPQK